MTIAPMRLHSSDVKPSTRPARRRARVSWRVLPPLASAARGHARRSRAAVSSCRSTYCTQSERHADAGAGEADVPVDSAARGTRRSSGPSSAPRLMPM